MEKPKPEERDLKDWDTKLTDEWIVYAQAMQTSHCRNTKANEAAEQYPEDLFHKIDDLVLIHVFGAVNLS
jgi:IS1 family transposase